MNREEIQPGGEFFPKIVNCIFKCVLFVLVRYVRWSRGHTYSTSAQYVSMISA